MPVSLGGRKTTPAERDDVIRKDREDPKDPPTTELSYTMRVWGDICSLRIWRKRIVIQWRVGR